MSQRAGGCANGANFRGNGLKWTHGAVLGNNNFAGVCNNCTVGFAKQGEGMILFYSRGRDNLCHLFEFGSYLTSTSGFRKKEEMHRGRGIGGADSRRRLPLRFVCRWWRRRTGTAENGEREARRIVFDA